MGLAFDVQIAKAEFTTWTVDDDGPAHFSTIQEAINNATSGDVIFVRAGIYYERVIVNKSVSLVGEDRDSTIIDGRNETGSVISIKANQVSIKGFTIRGSPTDSGILVDFSSGNEISHNTITNNNYGISLYSSGDNVISSNNISSNSNDGIFFYLSSDNVVSGNTISNNDDGIYLLFSGDNVVSGNTIFSNNNYGISLYYSTNNVVSGNTIFSNNNYGIYLALYSNNNAIYRNNFNNTYQVWSDSANVWDDGDEGNYWSDYTGQDLNEDGIGDDPYVIDVNNQDNHPLMGMISKFSVTLVRETYYVTTICNSTISDFRFEIGPETGNKIIRFNVTGEDGTVGFCRIAIPTELMNYPYILLVGGKETVPTLLDVSNESHVYLYFTYVHSTHTVTIISSKMLHLYNELLDKHVKLQINLVDLNVTYYALLNNYSVLLANYSQLQESYRALNDSYQEHLFVYSKNVQNIRNLMYIFAATAGIFITTTIYLSKHAHAVKPRYSKTRDEY
jgi:parallel beta-helix repeat protein